MSENEDEMHIDANDLCPETAGERHEPDWSTVKVEWDGGETYVDITCRRCGRSGCIGTSKTLGDDICW